MLFSKLIPLAFAATTLATPTVLRRDLATIQRAFASVSAAVTNLDNSILALTPQTDPQSAISTLTAQSQAVVDALNAGTATVTPTSSLSLVDALGLLQTSQQLVNNVNKTVTDLIGKKSIVDNANAGGIVVTQLQNQKTAAQAFIAAVVSKVPTAAQNLANQQASQVIAVLDNGIAAFTARVKKLFRKA